MSIFKKSQKKQSSPKKQRSHWQKQELRQRIIGFIGVAVVAVVVIMLAAGWIFKQYLPIDRHMRTTVIEACGDKYSMAYYVDMLAFQTGVYAENGWADYFTGSAEQAIKDSAVMRAVCAKLGISVSNSDVKQYVKEIQDAYRYETGFILKDSAALRDYARGVLLEMKLRDDYFGPDIPVTAEYRDVMAMFVESQSQLDEIRALLAVGGDFGAIAEQYSLDSKTKDGKGALGSHPNGVFDYLLKTDGMDNAIFNQSVGSLGVYADDGFSKSMGYWLVKVTDRNEDNSEVRVSAMLLSSLEEAESIKSRLNRGENFTALAEQYSQCWSDEDKDDLGWITSKSAVYSNYVFDQSNAIGKVSDPIKDNSQSTKGGYWLFRVVASVENEVITAQDRSDLITKAVRDWLDDKKADTQTYSVVSYLDDEKRDFAAARVNKNK